MPSVYIETYGCQMNVSDSELMYGKLQSEGYVTQDSPIGADVVLINTCAIRENAEQRVIGRLGELRRDLKPGAILGVTGCMAQRLGPRLLATDTLARLVANPIEIPIGAITAVIGAPVFFILLRHTRARQGGWA